jgi:hypothetical protein
MRGSGVDFDSWLTTPLSDLEAGRYEECGKCTVCGRRRPVGTNEKRLRCLAVEVRQRCPLSSTSKSMAALV